MASERNRILKVSEYLESLGIVINIAKNKARGNKGIFVRGVGDSFRIDVAKNLSEDKTLAVLVHEFAHYLHYKYDSSLESLDFVFEDLTDEMLDELIKVTVSFIPKNDAEFYYNQKSRINDEIRTLTKELKVFYPNFKMTVPCKPIERKINFPLKYLLKYDRVRVLLKEYSVSALKKDFPNLGNDVHAYLLLKSKKRALTRINRRILKLNKYYNKPTELFARFLELYVLSYEKSKEIAPLVTNKIDKQISDNNIPELNGFISCMYN